MTEGTSNGESLYIIQEGSVKVFVSDEEGREQIINMQGPGDYFGELAAIDNAPRSASVITLEPSVISIVSRQNFMSCLEANPGIAFELIRGLVERVRALTEDVKNLGLRDVYGRVAYTLSKLAVEEDEETFIPHRLTRQDIACMVGASREMVGRIVHDLIEGGYIRITKQRRIILMKRLPPAW